MDWKELLPLLGLGGIIGGIIGAYLQPKFQHQKQMKEWEHELKKKRYLAINILLLSRIEKNGLEKLIKHRPSITTIEKLDEEISTELLNSYLFASNDVITALINFIKEPSYHYYYPVVQSMRKDLWYKSVVFKTKFNLKGIEFN